MKQNNCHLQSAKISFKNEGKIKVFSGKNKQTTTKTLESSSPALKKVLKHELEAEGKLARWKVKGTKKEQSR